jgi:hypothetical protein
MNWVIIPAEIRICQIIATGLSPESESRASDQGQSAKLLIHKNGSGAATRNSSQTKGLIIWSLLSRRLVVVATTKPNLGHLAPASEVAGGHTILKLADHALFKMVRYVFVRPLGPELDGQYSA